MSFSPPPKNGISFAQFIYGEIGQESGGNYNARSPAGALGKYQILGSNIPSWSREILGYSITPQQFLNNPELQDKIAIGKLWKYFQAYGPEGAASAWYTGNPDAWKSGGGGDNYGGPSAAGYVQSVINRAKGYSGDGSDLTHDGKPIANWAQINALSTNGAGSGGGVPYTSAQPTYADYSATDSLGNLLHSIPELHTLVDKAVSGGWTLDKFQNAVENSHWWKTHAESTRQAIIQQANDPATWNNRLSNAINSVTDLAHQLGFTVSAGQAKAIASAGIFSGNDSNQQWLTRELGERQNYSHATTKSTYDGQMAQSVNQLQQMASDYGYNWTPAQLAKNAQGIVMGLHTTDTFQSLLKNWAASAFPALAKDIQGGMTVKQLADPYFQSMSNLLEVPQGSLSLYTPVIRKALQGTQDPKTGQRVQMNLSDFEDQVRQDPRWQYTQNARDTMSQALLKLGSDFGFGPNG